MCMACAQVTEDDGHCDYDGHSPGTTGAKGILFPSPKWDDAMVSSQEEPRTTVHPENARGALLCARVRGGGARAANPPPARARVLRATPR